MTTTNNTLTIDKQKESKKKSQKKGQANVQVISKAQQRLNNISKKLGLSFAIYQR